MLDGEMAVLSHACNLVERVSLYFLQKCAPPLPLPEDV